MSEQSAWRLLAILRITLGFIFLWTFLDKMFGLGFATSPNKSWLVGVSPTGGFLTYGTNGVFADIFKSLSGLVIVDYLFVLGMFGVGSALTLGIGMQIATVSGVLLILLIYLSRFPPANNPLVDEHLIYILCLLILYVSRAGEYWGLGKWWTSTKIVRRFPILG
ncbi:hypothetical protein KC614_00560 [candidate division WWE3 bacterium]|uniref:DoxX family protein n=1 Tax=candidate division WWE3 bacterium TaxID=2053526 RepID=A0A955LJV8_UNCKA|nr:hypothetical protein [candidate division WWE3 bacterium]